MIDLPQEIKTDIIRRVGHGGFRYLAPFIAAGREGRDAVFTPEVLRDACLDEFFFYGQMALETSGFRPFLMKCVEHGNLDAKYLEGVRILRQEGSKCAGWNLLLETYEANLNARVALGLFMICAGNYEDGAATIDWIWDNIRSVEIAVGVADFVLQHISSMALAHTGMYESTIRFPNNAPWCVYTTCTAQDVCSKCFAFWYSRILCSMC